MRTETPRKIFLKDYQPPAYLIDSIQLRISLHPTRTEVDARLAVRANPAVAEPGDLRLDGEDLALLAIALNGAPLPPDGYRIEGGHLVVSAPPAQFTLDIRTRIAPAQNTRLEGLYRSGTLYCTQCEAQGFRRITYYPDRPDVQSVFTTRIEADKAEAPVLLSNGNEIERGDLPGGRHFAVWHDPHPKPAYLFALAAGALTATEDSFTTMSGRTVRLRIFVDPGNEAQVGYAMDALKRSMAWDEEAFGREYDLDDFMIVAVRSFNMGAMENKGLNIFNSALLLATPETATDDDYARIEGVIAHEYFHNWTGNRITCRDWFQLCLKEGLTVFRDQLFSADMRGAAVRRIEDVLRLRARQFPEDDGPLSHPPRPDSFIEIDNFYTATVYEKGAEICRMLHTVLGAEGFRRGMDCYFDRHDGGAITVEDFIAALSDGSGTDLSAFMAWYAEAGRPAVSVASTYDPKTKILTLTFSQSRAGKARPVPIPIRFGVLDASGRDMKLAPPPGLTADEHGWLLLLTGVDQRLSFACTEAPGALSLLRGFSAPVTLKRKGAEDEDLFLFAHDSDPFNRWQGGQRAMTRHLLGSGPAESAQALVHAMGRTLQAPDLDPAFKALALALPSLTELAQAQLLAVPGRPLDYEALWTAREALRRDIGAGLEADWERLLRDLTARASAATDAASAGLRALSNRCLAYLSALGTAHGGAVEAHYRQAKTMTERLCALTLAVHDGHAARDGLLADFYARFETDPTVIDKWFQVQATAPHKTVLNTVKSLLAHPAFERTNPNRFRALVASYAFGNLARFHGDGASAYEFVADEVLKIDAINPQLAARLLSSLESWSHLSSNRQAEAQNALRRVLSKDGISSNVFEIANKCLSPVR